MKSSFLIFYTDERNMFTSYYTNMYYTNIYYTQMSLLMTLKCNKKTTAIRCKDKTHLILPTKLMSPNLIICIQHGIIFTIS